MLKANKKHTIGALLGLGLAALLIWGKDDKPQYTYYHNEGNIFGTYYNIRYEASEDLQEEIKAAFREFDNSLSLFNPHSILSAVNANRDTMTNAVFEAMFNEAARVNALSNGAFDITVAPLVNYWGFGNKERFHDHETTRSRDMDSIRSFIGFDKVSLVNHHIIKSDPRVQLDGGAVAKGQACDVIADLLRNHDSYNYLVDIGGEVVAKGYNSKGEPWHIGITKPNLNNEGAQADLQEILAVTDIAMATSGNYRNYYYEAGERRSHTIDPRTGFPVQHSLLSATVVSKSCMRADALATACMVLGAEQALDMISRAGDAACYLIVAQNDSLTTLTSSNWHKMITK
ncbi:MAG: FAD:protein FMN transferase [Paludibacteraceae bacterium]|nr:FAD:protein FMN transferase [Paludibacteraceae bacterium]